MRYLEAIQTEMGELDDMTLLHRLAVEAVDERKSKAKWRKLTLVHGLFLRLCDANKVEK